jgi:hypothetical protein
MKRLRLFRATQACDTQASSEFPPRRSRLRNLLRLGLLIALLCAALISVRPDSASFCEICGARDAQTSWAVRGTNVSLFKTHTIAPTPMSELLTKKNLVALHVHRWRAPQAVPDPRDEFGPPVIESLEYINAPRVVNFMRDVADYADPVTAGNWRETVMQPHYTPVIDDALRFSRVPAAGFADRTEFLIWWGQNAYALSHRLRQLTESD